MFRGLPQGPATTSDVADTTSTAPHALFQLLSPTMPAFPPALLQGPATTSDLADTIELANGCACCRCLACCARAVLVLCCIAVAARCCTESAAGWLALQPHFIVHSLCSIADELFGSFENLLALSDRRGVPYDR